MLDVFKKNKTDKRVINENKINWILLRSVSEKYVKNLIIDEKLLAAMVVRNIYPEKQYLLLMGERLRWYIGDDNEVYAVYALNKQKFDKG